MNRPSWLDLDELWQRRIVRVQSISGYDFSHERLCEVAYGEVPPARRRLLHRRVAVALEGGHGLGAESASIADCRPFSASGGELKGNTLLPARR